MLKLILPRQSLTSADASAISDCARCRSSVARSSSARLTASSVMPARPITCIRARRSLAHVRSRSLGLWQQSLLFAHQCSTCMSTQLTVLIAHCDSSCRWDITETPNDQSDTAPARHRGSFSKTAHSPSISATRAEAALAASDWRSVSRRAARSSAVYRSHLHATQLVKSLTGISLQRLCNYMQSSSVSWGGGVYYAHTGVYGQNNCDVHSESRQVDFMAQNCLYLRHTIKQAKRYRSQDAKS